MNEIITCAIEYDKNNSYTVFYHCRIICLTFTNKLLSNGRCNFSPKCNCLFCFNASLSLSLPIEVKTTQ